MYHKIGTQTSELSLQNFPKDDNDAEIFVRIVRLHGIFRF